MACRVLNGVVWRRLVSIPRILRGLPVGVPLAPVGCRFGLQCPVLQLFECAGLLVWRCDCNAGRPGLRARRKRRLRWHSADAAANENSNANANRYGVWRCIADAPAERDSAQKLVAHAVAERDGVRKRIAAAAAQRDSA